MPGDQQLEDHSAHLQGWGVNSTAINTNTTSDYPALPTAWTLSAYDYQHRFYPRCIPLDSLYQLTVVLNPLFRQIRCNIPSSPEIYTGESRKEVFDYLVEIKEIQKILLWHLNFEWPSKAKMKAGELMGAFPVVSQCGGFAALPVQSVEVAMQMEEEMRNGVYMVLEGPKRFGGREKERLGYVLSYLPDRFINWEVAGGEREKRVTAMEEEMKLWSRNEIVEWLGYREKELLGHYAKIVGVVEELEAREVLIVGCLRNMESEMRKRYLEDLVDYLKGGKLENHNTLTSFPSTRHSLLTTSLFGYDVHHQNASTARRHDIDDGFIPPLDSPQPTPFTERYSPITFEAMMQDWASSNVGNARPTMSFIEYTTECSAHSSSLVLSNSSPSPAINSPPSPASSLINTLINSPQTFPESTLFQSLPLSLPPVPPQPLSLTSEEQLYLSLNATAPIIPIIPPTNNKPSPTYLDSFTPIENASVTLQSLPVASPVPGLEGLGEPSLGTYDSLASFSRMLLDTSLGYIAGGVMKARSRSRRNSITPTVGTTETDDAPSLTTATTISDSSSSIAPRTRRHSTTAIPGHVHGPENGWGTSGKNWGRFEKPKKGVRGRGWGFNALGEVVEGGTPEDPEAIAENARRRPAVGGAENVRPGAENENGESGKVSNSTVQQNQTGNVAAELGKFNLD